MMVLVDTAVWINHLRAGNPRLDQLLRSQRVLAHPLVIGELACGRLDDRARVLDLLAGLEQPLVAQHHEVLHFIGQHQLFDRGLGWIDISLLASARLTGCALWTSDRGMMAAAEELKVAADGKQ